MTPPTPGRRLPRLPGVVVALLVAVLAYSTHQRIQVRRQRMLPERAVAFLVLGKASALAGALVARVSRSACDEAEAGSAGLDGLDRSDASCICFHVQSARPGGTQPGTSSTGGPSIQPAWAHIATTSESSV